MSDAVRSHALVAGCNVLGGVRVEGSSVVRDVWLQGANTTAWYLQQMSISDYAARDNGVISQPSFFVVIGGMIHVWPTPDQNYDVNVHFDGERPPVRLAMNPAWVIAYRDEFERLRAT